jgi:hypothetical protein
VNDWVEHAKVAVVSILGVTATLADINQMLQLGIALASLAYAVLKALSAYQEYTDKRK